MRKTTLVCALALLVLAAVGTLVTLKALSRTQHSPDPLQSRLGMYGVMGFVVTEVDPNSTAEQAGLKPGDIVTGLNGQVTGIREFQSAIWSSPSGTTLSLEFLRFNPVNGKTEENKVTVKTMSFTARAQFPQTNVPVSATEVSRGLLDCPLGCCDTCKSFSPNKYCYRQNYFTGFRNCTSDGWGCKGQYCA